MLDTNIVSHVIHKPHGIAAGKLSAHDPAALCISIFVAAELRFGAENVQSARLAARIETLLASVNVVPFETPGDHHYGRTRAFLKSAGTPIGPNDLWIAAHALALGVTLITANLAEFRRVPGLAVENWLE